MRTINFFALVTVFISFSSCDSDDDSPEVLSIESKLISNIHAPQSADYSTNPPTITGDYIKFSFESGAITTGNDWDIAFRGSTILVNGGEKTAEDQPERSSDAGAYITTGTLASVAEVNTTSFKLDNATDGLAIPTGSGNGWYNYDPTTHIIAPIAGKVLVVRTNTGRYAKLEILNYYENSSPNEDLSNSQFYTFNYVYQPNKLVTSF